MCIQPNVITSYSTWKDGQTDEWTDREMDARKHVQTQRQMNERVEGAIAL